MSHRDQPQGRDPRQKRTVEEIVTNLRQHFEALEHALVAQDPKKASSETQPLTLAKVPVAQSLYVILRVPTGFLANLSGRQREVHKLLLDGHSRRAIAVRLRISPRTVDTYFNRLKVKCQVKSRQALFEQGRFLS
jgi:DNA-binding CsgD family transcriptional regulator